MATVTGYTAARMQEIIDTTIQSGSIDGNGHLILTTYNGTLIDAGPVLGTVPDASDTIKGIVELATNAEAITGTDTVRAITPAALKAALDDLLQTKLFPVGSYYTSDLNTNPAIILGFGTWTAVADQMLIGAGSSFTAGTTGGSITHTIDTANLPPHTHSDGTLATASVSSHTHGAGSLATNSTGSHTHTIESDFDGAFGGSVFSVHRGGGQGTHDSDPSSSAGSHSHTITGTTGAGGSHSHDVTGSTGSGPGASAPINHMPPHRVVYIWRRTA